MSQANDPRHGGLESSSDDPALATAKERRMQVLRNAAAIYLAVGAGSILGGVARWMLSGWVSAWIAAGPHWGTLFVNVTGSFLIGFYVALTGPGGRWQAGTVQRQFVMTGICGGYTTFSIFSIETVLLFEAGAFLPAGINVGISLAGWLAAVWCGFALASRLNPAAR